MNKVSVNKNQCSKIAKILAGLSFLPAHFNRRFLKFSTDRETLLRAWMFSTVICHQTHSLINNKLNLKGWDFLEYVYTNLGKENSKLIDPTYLSKLSINELSNELKPLFSEDNLAETCTLDRLEERAKFIIDISQHLVENYNGRLENMLQKTEGYLFNKGTGLYELLEKMESYQDPLRKKSTIYIKWIIDSQIFSFKDEENLVPVMDYHMQRVLLRTRCIEVNDLELKQKLIAKTPLESDAKIRNASVEAVRTISKFANKNISIIHDFLWPLGRSCCNREPLCVVKKCCKNPCTLETFVDLPKHDSCIFSGVCKGETTPEYRDYWQPIVDTHFY